MPDDYHPNFNASPSQQLPVVLNTRPLEAVMARWGKPEVRSGEKLPGSESYIKPVERIKNKDIWKEKLAHQRCLILSDGFYLWKKINNKSSVPYRVVPIDKKLICFAGIWDELEFTENPDNKLYFFILVRRSYKPVNNIAETMPVVITREQEKKWLDPACAMRDLWKEIDMEDWGLLKYYPVSPKIANREENSSQLIKPSPPADQCGNLTLFE